MEKVYIPEYFNKETIQSYYLDKLFNQKDYYEFQDDQKKIFFPLDILRNLYRQDTDLFYKIVLELTIRGFIIESIKKSSIFPPSYVEQEPVIIKNNASNNINIDTIDFEFYRLGMLLNTLKVKSSYFFENIPLNGFLTLNPKLNIQLFSEELLNAGFVIANLRDYEKRKIEKESQIEEIVNSSHKISVPLLKILEDLRTRSYLNFVIIEDFIKLDYEQLDFLSKYNIHYLYEINPNLLKKYGEIYGQEMLNRFIDKLKKELNSKNLNKIFYEAFERLILNGIPKLEMNPIISDNKYNTLKNFNTKEHIYYLSEFGVTEYKKFMKVPGVGIKKILLLLDLFNSCLDDEICRNVEIVQKDVVKRVDYLYILPLLSDSNIWQGEFSSGIGIIGTISSIQNIKDSLKKSSKRKSRKMELLDRNIKDTMEYIQNLDIEYIKKKIIFESNYKNLTINHFISWIGFSEKDSKLSSKFEYLQNYLDISLDQLDNIITGSTISQEMESLTYLYKQVLYQISIYEEISKKTDDFLKGKLNGNESLIYDERISKQNTLEAIGNQVGVTRERVRQIENKIMKLLIPQMRLYIVPSILTKLYKEGTIYLSSTNLVISPGILNILKSTDNLLGYDQKYDLFYLKNDKHAEQCLKIWKNFVSNMSMIEKKAQLELKFNEFSQNFPQNIRSYFVENAEKLLAFDNYLLVGNKYFVRQNGSLDQRMVSIIKMFNNMTISLSNKQDITKFREYYLLFYPNYSDYIETSDTLLTRKLGGIFTRTDNLIMSDTCTYTVYNFKNIPRILLHEIYEYLAEYFKENSVISYKKIYNLFEEELINKKVTAYMMYFLLKYCYPDDFSFGKGNTMNIYANNAEKLTTEQIIEHKVVQMGGQVSKIKLAEELGYEIYTIDQTTGYSNKLKIIEGIVTINSFSTEKLSEALRTIIITTIENSLEQYHYVIVNDLYYQLKFNVDFSKELREVGIDSNSELVSVAKELIPSLKGNTKYLYDEKNQVQSSDVLLDDFGIGDEFTRGDMIKKGEKFGYSLVSMYSFIRDWENMKIIISLDGEHFILRKSFSLTNEIKKSVYQYLSEILSDNKYITLANIYGYRKHLPKVKRPLKWTPELIRFVALELGYTVIRPSNVTYKVDPIIVLNPKYSKLTYHDLLNEAMDHYHGSMYSEAVYDYLVEQGLIIRRKNGSKEIPEEVLVENVLYVNEIYIVERIGENV